MAKRLAFIAPVDWLVGNVSGQQNITYASGSGYSIPTGASESAVGYEPRLIAKRVWRSDRRYFQVRTKTTVNMTLGVRMAMALMGGACALFSSLVRDKTTAIYQACVNACPKDTPLRAFVIPLLRAGLAAKNAHISIAQDVYIVNPWISSDTPNVPVSAANLSKFTILSN